MIVALFVSAPHQLVAHARAVVRLFDHHGSATQQALHHSPSVVARSTHSAVRDWNAAGSCKGAKVPLVVSKLIPLLGKEARSRKGRLKTQAVRELGNLR
jgi:hypothetical protein